MPLNFVFVRVIICDRQLAGVNSDYMCICPGMLYVSDSLALGNLRPAQMANLVGQHIPIFADGRRGKQEEDLKLANC